jgi:hypothetical protein
VKLTAFSFPFLIPRYWNGAAPEVSFSASIFDLELPRRNVIVLEFRDKNSSANVVNIDVNVEHKGFAKRERGVGNKQSAPNVPGQTNRAKHFRGGQDNADVVVISEIP